MIFEPLVDFKISQQNWVNYKLGFTMDWWLKRVKSVHKLLQLPNNKYTNFRFSSGLYVEYLDPYVSYLNKITLKYFLELL